MSASPFNLASIARTSASVASVVAASGIHSCTMISGRSEAGKNCCGTAALKIPTEATNIATVTPITRPRCSRHQSTTLRNFA
jgi:hypothetical protein